MRGVPKSTQTCVRMRQAARLSELKFPGRRKRLSQAGHLRPEVVEAKRVHDDAKRAAVEAEKRRTLSRDEFARWKRATEKNRRAVVKRTADIRLIRRAFPACTADKISQYRRDGTLEAARLFCALLDAKPQRAGVALTTCEACEARA